MKRLAIALIRGYQSFVSPFRGASCRFVPTCSQYAVEAIEELGVVRGVLAGAWRILRCQPFCRGGYDPVRTRREADRAPPVTAPSSPADRA